MSNIKRHFRKRNLKTNLPLGATNIKKHHHVNYSKIQRCGVLPLHLCEFKLKFGDFGLADMLRLSHYSGKADADLFSSYNQFLSISPDSCSTGSLSKHQTHRQTPLFSIPHLTLTFLCPSYQPLPPSLPIPFVFSASLKTPLSCLLS